MLTLVEAKNLCRTWHPDFGFGSLLTLPDGNAKLSKSWDWSNSGISLLPAKFSGFNVCAESGLCELGCLANTGRAEFDNGGIRHARMSRTQLFFEDRELFWQILLAECSAIDRKASRLNLPVAFRPNIISDLNWPELMPGLFEAFPDWKIYGYTKVRKHVRDYIAGKFPSNYHITYSWSERTPSIELVREYLDCGVNTAVPFYEKETMRPCIPDTWKGMPVLNGDLSDIRFQDPRGIVGLKAKLPKNREKAIAKLQEANGFFVGV